MGSSTIGRYKRRPTLARNLLSSSEIIYKLLLNYPLIDKGVKLSFDIHLLLPSIALLGDQKECTGKHTILYPGVND